MLPRTSMTTAPSKFLGLLLIIVAQAPATACSPGEEPVGSGGAGSGGDTASGGGLSSGGSLGSGGGLASGGAASGGSGSGGDGAGSGGVAGVGGNPPITCGVSPGAGGSTEVIDPTFETVQFVVEQTPCNGSDCHGHEGNPLDLKVDSPQELYDHLLSTVSARCGGLPVVAPGDPGNSALVRLLKGPCGDLAQMPDGCICDPDPFINNCLPPQYVEAVEKWVEAGAPQ